MKEEWRPIKGLEGCCEVSNLGRVRTVDRYVRRYSGRLGDYFPNLAYISGSILKIYRNKSKFGRSYVHLRSFLKSDFYVDRIVADAFVTNPDPVNFHEINHIDGDFANNTSTNLEWCTHRYDERYSDVKVDEDKFSMLRKSRYQYISQSTEDITDTSTAVRYRNAKDAEKHLNLPSGSVLESMENNTCIEGHKFAPAFKIAPDPMYAGKMVIELNTGCMFTSSGAAERILGLKGESVRGCIRSGDATPEGYRFDYV